MSKRYLVVDIDSEEVVSQLTEERWEYCKRLLKYPNTIEPNEEFEIKEKD